MTSITIKLPKELKSRLESQARISGKSRSALVRDSLEKNLALPKKQKTSLLDTLQDLAGKGSSGIADLATNPKHLEEFGQWRR